MHQDVADNRGPCAAGVNRNPLDRGVNHSAAVYLVISTGVCGCVSALAGPDIAVARLVVFAGVLAAGLFYFVCVLRRALQSRRARAIAAATR